MINSLKDPQTTRDHLIRNGLDLAAVSVIGFGLGACTVLDSTMPTVFASSSSLFVKLGLGVCLPAAAVALSGQAAIYAGRKIDSAISNYKVAKLLSNDREAVKQHLWHVISLIILIASPILISAAIIGITALINPSLLWVTVPGVAIGFFYILARIAEESSKHFDSEGKYIRKP